MTLRGRSFLTLADFTPDELRHLLDVAIHEKRERRHRARPTRFLGRSLALLYEKPSTRTRSSFETAFGEEGGHPVFLSHDHIHLGEKETLEDTARLLGRMYDLIQFRGFAQRDAEDLARYSGIPVINGLTDERHPTQILADLLTVEESFGRLDGIEIAYVGDGRNNIAYSLLIGCSMAGTSLRIVAPRELHPAPEAVRAAIACGDATGAQIRITDVPDDVDGCHAIYTDVWASMGEEAETASRAALLEPYRVTEQMLQAAGRDDVVFMHDLPAIKGSEVTLEVFEGPRSVVWDQAENRKHAARSIMLCLLGLDNDESSG